MENPSVMIEAKGLVKQYSNTKLKAVDNISFSLNKGEIACLIGTSGCGKTTTIKMINRLIEPTEGEIRVNGQKSHQVDSVTWRRQTGYVIQKAGLLPHLTVRQNISLLSKILKRKKTFIKSRTDELLETVGLNPHQFAGCYPSELSGGQQQRVGIARALMENPPILLMDEPFGALDPITRNSMHEEFLALNQKLHKTIILVTHDMKEAFKLGDQIILMNKGQIVQKGSPKEITDTPANDFVKEFLSAHIN